MSPSRDRSDMNAHDNERTIMDRHSDSTDDRTFVDERGSTEVPGELDSESKELVAYLSDLDVSRPEFIRMAIRPLRINSVCTSCSVACNASWIRLNRTCIKSRYCCYPLPYMILFRVVHSSFGPILPNLG